MPLNDLIVDDNYAEHRLRMQEREANLFMPMGYPTQEWGKEQTQKAGQYTADVAKSIPHGIAEALTNATDSLAALAASLDLHGTAEDPTKFGQEAEHIEGAITNPLAALEPKTAPGQLSGGMAQFLTGFLPFLKMFRALGAAGYIGELGAGMAADATVFKPFQDNLANLIDQLPAEIKSPALRYLAEPVRQIGEALKIERDDTRAEAILKRTAEGLMLASFVDPFIKVMRLIKEAGVGPSVAKRVGREAVEQTGMSIMEHGDRVHQLHMKSVMEPSFPGGGSTYNVRTGESMIGQDAVVVSIYPGRQVKVSGQVTPEHLSGYIEMNKDLLMGGDPRVNLGTWYDPEEGKTFLDVVATVPREHMEAVHGLGKEFDQKAAFDLYTMEEIPIGGTGQGIESTIPEAQRLAMVPTETTGAVKLQRYMDQPGLTEVDPTKKEFYTGVRGEERGRLEGVLGEKEVGAPHRLTYYTEGAVHEPQVMQGRRLYETEIPKGRLYNALADPLGLRAKATPEGMVRADANTYERLMKEAGFAGYVDPRTGHAAIWEKLPVREIENALPPAQAAPSILQRIKEMGKGLLTNEAGFIETGEKFTKSMANKYAVEGAANLAMGKREFNKWLKEAKKTVGEEGAMLLREAAEKKFSDMLDSAPRWMTRTRKMLDYWRTGKYLADWYNDIPQELEMIFGKDADMMTSFLASTSTRTSSKSNITLAMKAYKQWVIDGRNAGFFDFKGFMKSHRENLRRATGGFDLSGPKVTNFDKALRGDLEAVVVDRWMMRAFGLKNETPTDAQYEIIESIVRKMAAKVGVKPAEYQAGIWVGIKTLEGAPGDVVDSWKTLIRDWLDANPLVAEELGLSYKPKQPGLGLLEPEKVPTSPGDLESKLKILGLAEFEHRYNPLNLEARLVKGLTAKGLSWEQARAQIHPQFAGYEEMYRGVNWRALATKHGAAGFTSNDLAMVLGRIAAGGIGGGLIGDTPEDRIRNAMIGMGLAGAAPTLIRKMASVIRSGREGMREVVGETPEGLGRGARRASERPETQSWEELVAGHRVPDEVRATWDEFNALVDTFEWRTQKAKRAPGTGVRPREVAHLEGEFLGWTIDDVKKMAGTMNLSDEQASALINVMQKTGRSVIDAAQKWMETEAPEDLDNFLRLFSTFMEMDPKRFAAKAEAGRSLGILNDPLAGYNRFLDQFAATAEFGQHVGPTRLAQMMAELSNPEQLARIVHHGAKPGMNDVLLELWINGLLSGPSTHAVNFLGNMAVSLWAIPERAIASRLGRGVHKGEATAMMFGWVHSIADAWKLAGKAFKEGRPVSGLQKVETKFRKAISSEAFGMEGGVWASFIDYMGEVIRLPGRFLLSGDEFAKTINSRMQAYALAYREGIGQGLKGKEFANYVKANLDNLPSKIKQQADEFAAVQTFTNELGGFGQALSGLAESSGFARIIMPFVKTPINIFKWTTERLPMTAPFYKEVRADIAAGGVRRDMALAKMSTGALSLAMFAALAAGGMITGRGPKNKVLKQAWESDGRREYSIFMPVLNKWVSYKRTDPVGMIMGLAADFVTAFQQGDQETYTEYAETAAAATLAAFTRNLSSKTYLKGVSDAVEAITSEEPDAANQWLKNFVGSFVPAIAATAARQIDDVQREAHTITEKWLSRTPWLSKGVPPRRNIFGEIQHYTGALGPDWISPFYSSDKKDPDPLMKEIAANETEIMMPPWSINSIKISSKQRDKWITLMNEVEIDGVTMREQLNDLIKSDEYKEATKGADGMRSEMIKRVIYTYKNAAYYELRQQDKELDLKLRKQEVEDLQVKYGSQFDPTEYMEAIAR